MICQHILYIPTVKLCNSSISNNSIQHKSIKLNDSKYCYVSITIQLKMSFVYIQLKDQTVLFLIIQFSMSFVCTQFKCQTVLFDPQVVPYQVLPLQTRVDLGIMAMKGYSAFLRAPALLSYLGHMLDVGSYPSSKMQSMYSTVPADLTAVR